MRKLFILFLSLTITVSCVGCIKTAKEPKQTESTAVYPQTVEPIPENMNTTEPIQAEAPKQEAATVSGATSAANYDFSYADVADVFANADSYSGKIYASPFQIASDLRKAEDKWIYFAGGFSKNKDENHYAILTFDADAPELKDGEIVYVYGAIEGTTQIQAKDGKEITFLILSVNQLETELPDSASTTKPASFSFTDAECTGTQDTLRIEVSGLSFSSDGAMLSTKTTDSAAKGVVTYYMDIFAHQNGHFVWYPNCDFWVQSGLIGSDNVPLGALDSSKDLVLEFFPFDAKGRLVYPAITIRVPLSGE